MSPSESMTQPAPSVSDNAKPEHQLAVTDSEFRGELIYFIVVDRVQNCELAGLATFNENNGDYRADVKAAMRG